MKVVQALTNHMLVYPLPSPLLSPSIPVLKLSNMVTSDNVNFVLETLLLLQFYYSQNMTQTDSFSGTSYIYFQSIIDLLAI